MTTNKDLARTDRVRQLLESRDPFVEYVLEGACVHQRVAAEGRRPMHADYDPKNNILTFFSMNGDAVQGAYKALTSDNPPTVRAIKLREPDPKQYAAFLEDRRSRGLLGPVEPEPAGGGSAGKSGGDPGAEK